MLTEYLYFDVQRLDQYIDQLVESPIIYDKVPVVKTELSVTGPKAGADQARFPRQRTTHEKIELLLKEGRKKHIVADNLSQLQSASDATKLYLHTMNARKVCVPGKPEVADGAGLNLWVPDFADTTQAVDHSWVVLVEDRVIGSPEPKYAAFSSFSRLSFLLMALVKDRQQLRETIFTQYMPDGVLDPVQILNQFWVSDQHDDPLKLLSDMGALPGDRRNIETLFRVRFFDVYPDSDGFLIFGYPIYITERPISIRKHE